MKNRIKKILKFVVLPLVILMLVASMSAVGYRAYRQSTIADEQRIVSPNGIDVLEAIEIGESTTWIQIRGVDRSNPVLLFLHGGPGSPMMAIGHVFQDAWEEHFTVVHWDQRESGKSYRGEETIETMNLEQAIDDTLELIAHLRDRFSQDKIVLMGHSWGTFLGVEVIQRNPDWFHAYLGIGQVVNMQENERVTYEYALEQAKERNHTEALAELEALAPYPSPDGMFEKMMLQRKWLLEFGGSIYGATNYGPMIKPMLVSPAYSLMDLYRFAKGASFVPNLLIGTLMSVDIRQLGTEYQVPVFIFSGRYDYQVPSSINHAWFETITAPHKEYVWFEKSCHSPMVAESKLFAEELVTRVLPFTVDNEIVEKAK